jgi:uncharacterized RDD family membrane protein YckC
MNASHSFSSAIPQNVGVGYRLLAVVLDSIILGLITGLLSPVIGLNNLYLLTSIGNILAFFYYFLFEATVGATPGKMACRLRVVNDDGSSISWKASIIRNLLRFIDSLPICYLVGAILIWSTPQKKRLGDLVAHTVVRRNVDMISKS